ncbi:DUF4271 domain-containing protein [Lutibacter sp.]|uniref:DUF4271 domain-containing protein n=1 Tax=Lutibacter sp. TaxID=1925666 RepID=UPI00356885D9
MFEASKIISENNDWMTFVFLFILVLLTANKLLFNNRILHTGTLFLQKKFLLIYFGKDKSVVFNLFQIVLFSIKVLSISLIIYHINNYFKINSSLEGFVGYIIIASCLTLYFVIHYLLGVFLAAILNFQKAYKKVVYDKLSYFNNLILWILPFLVVYSYTSVLRVLFFNILLFLFIGLLVVRYLLLLTNNKNLIFNNIFYFILYLCALEIAPFVIILKLTI